MSAEGSVSIPTVYGAAFSVYVQAVRLTLSEKGVPHALVEANPFAPSGAGEAYLARQPFGLIPAFADGRVALYESEAIARYVDEAYDGPPLQPDDPIDRARMNQLLSILRAYAYPIWVRTLYHHLVARQRKAEPVDQDAVARAWPVATIALGEVDRLMGEGGGAFLAGPHLTLADLFCAPMLACLVDVPDADTLIAATRHLSGWQERMAARDSVREIVRQEQRSSPGCESAGRGRGLSVYVAALKER